LRATLPLEGKRKPKEKSINEPSPAQHPLGKKAPGGRKYLKVGSEP